MSRLSKFLGKPEDIEIEGEKFTIHPLKGKHLQLFMNENMNNEQKMKVAREIVKLSLEPSEPEITDEEIENLPVDIFNFILEKAMEVNGLSEKKDGIERIKKLKAKAVS